MEPKVNLPNNDTIVAVSTPPGTGGIAVIRLSGEMAFDIIKNIWSGKDIDTIKSHTVHLGYIGEKGELPVDNVIITIYRAPHSFTGENTVEISCHGSRWIQREIINLLIRHGARAALPGEFSQRAFLNGNMDLAQTEGIIDLISASSRAAHRLAMMQANGSFSTHLEKLRSKLVDFASLLELELDFSEEDVQFADRTALLNLATEIINQIKKLSDSYATGLAFKDGIPVVIAGLPNAGKSTLLNYLLDSEKAIVSEIPGTTRDIIEDTRDIGGVNFRFIDTAGLRVTDDIIEKIGINRAGEQLSKAAIIIWMLDSSIELHDQLQTLIPYISESDAKSIIILNKSDISGISSGVTDSEKTQKIKETLYSFLTDEIKDKIMDIIPASASTGDGISNLQDLLIKTSEDMMPEDSDIMITNARHYESLIKGRKALEEAVKGIETGISADFIAQDVRSALHHLGTITGAITTPTLLQSIFSRFCIGK